MPLVDDDHLEPNKRFNVLLVTEHPKTLIDRGIATVVIRDNDGKQRVGNEFHYPFGRVYCSRSSSGG